MQKEKTHFCILRIIWKAICLVSITVGLTIAYAHIHISIHPLFWELLRLTPTDRQHFDFIIVEIYENLKNIVTFLVTIMFAFCF
jgi:hypothetical protein